MSGGIIQLAAKGAQDIYLTGEPEITFFKMVARRHTDFSIETINQVFMGDLDFGQTITSKLSRNGDLVSGLCLKIVLPDPNPDIDDPSKYENFWVNSIGHALIDSVELEIGGVLVDRQNGMWMDIWSELTQKEEKKIGYGNMIGKKDTHYTPLYESCGEQITLYIPLNFWFCRNIGLALPIIALQYSDVKINLKIRPFDECIISKDGNKVPKVGRLHASLLVDYVFLSTEERFKFSQDSHEYLIEQLQYTTGSTIQENQTSVSIDLPFNHPVKELLWVIRRCDIGGVNNQWFNFSKEIAPKLSREDTFNQAKIQFNGTDRISEQDARYFRYLVPYKRHTRVPDRNIYCYSFSIKPEEHQNTGTANFSRMQARLLLNMGRKKNPVSQIHVYALNYNILRIEAGMCGVLFSN